MESRTLGSRPNPKPRTQKKFEAKATDRPSRGQGPRTQTQVFRKKKGSQNLFSDDPKKKDFKKIFSGEKAPQIFFSGDLYLRKLKKRNLCGFLARFLAFSNKISNGSKIVLSSRRGQGNFRGLEASRPRTSKCDLEAKDSTSVS